MGVAGMVTPIWLKMGASFSNLFGIKWIFWGVAHKSVTKN